MNNEQYLRDACYEVARTTMWDLKPVDTKHIQSHANNLYEKAQLIHTILSDIGCDLPMITRATHYLHQTQAIPPMGNDTHWFFNSLFAILEVACPNTGVDGAAKDFLLDMQNGIHQQLQKKA